MRREHVMHLEEVVHVGGIVLTAVVDGYLNLLKNTPVGLQHGLHPAPEGLAGLADVVPGE